MIKLYGLLIFPLSLLALNINGIQMQKELSTYIATPQEKLKIEADSCSNLSKDGKFYLYKTAQDKSIHCDDRTIQILIKNAQSHQGKIGHYKIGTYPKPMRGLKAYQAPKYFLTLKDSKDNIKLSTHFNARDFLCKQRSKYPKYLLVQTSLINLLERMLEELHHRGIKVERFVIMSGYRTPAYNKAIGSSTYSRHMYGDASDIYPDDNHDGFMDDLDGDGKTTDKDTKYLADLADYVQKKYGIKGGVGIYKRTSRHPRFVHVDTRGYFARWGH